MSLCSSFLGLYVFIEIEQWSQYKEYERTPKPFPSDSATVVASALTSITNSPVITYYEYLSRDENDTRLYEQLDFQIFYKAYLSGGIISSHHHHVDKNVPFDVHIETLTGVKWLVGNLTGKTTVQELKERIQEICFIPDTTSQRLIFNGRHLLNSKRLGAYNIGQDNVIYLEVRGSLDSIKFLNSDFLNVIHHLDEKSQKKLPGRCDWKRIPLTPSSTEKHSIYKTWPYSYHGTSTRKSRTIADDGLIHSKRSKLHKFTFGHGIYTTPDKNLASLYSHTFIFNGSKYLILLQNRVNPKTLVRLSRKRDGDGDYWVSPSDDDLKPYGLLIKKIGYCK
ncbi:2205_t:CDS:1 [Funneliformis mosseae]|uniref:2205_t:CDS:1 n=1 Tax=Funneliformis mosseae TaxID=27381 RepID=A0A9N9HLL3_FUNMO|nr:2205_t:CDS:1 [Funneliformis mosseae]